MITRYRHSRLFVAGEVVRPYSTSPAKDMPE